MKNIKNYVSELIATFILVMVGCGSAIAVYKIVPQSPVSNLIVALSFAIAILILEYSVDFVSGGHANPSVTIGHVSAGVISVKDAVFYIFGQFSGAIFAGLILFSVNNFNTGDEVVNLAANAIPKEGSFLTAGIFEFGITFLFVLVILLVSNNKNGVKNGQFTIAITLGAMIFIALPYTGGSLNAARSFGVAVFNGGDALASLPVFLIFPTLGGYVAGLVSKILTKDN